MEIQPWLKEHWLLLVPLFAAVASWWSAWNSSQAVRNVYSPFLKIDNPKALEHRPDRYSCQVFNIGNGPMLDISITCAEAKIDFPRVLYHQEQAVNFIIEKREFDNYTPVVLTYEDVHRRKYMAVYTYEDNGSGTTVCSDLGQVRVWSLRGFYEKLAFRCRLPKFYPNRGPK